MSLQDIYDKLDAALSGGVINLAASTVGGLDVTLEAVGITGTATLGMTGATLTLGVQSVVLAGTASYRNFSWSTTLTGVSVSPSDPNANTFTLAMQGLDATTPWTFGTSFTALPQSRVITVNGTLPLTAPVLAPLVVKLPQLTAPAGPGLTALRIQGGLVLTGSLLEPYAAYFAPGGAPLRLDGAIDFSHPLVPVITAFAAAPGVSLAVPIIDVREVGIKLQSDYPDVFALDPDAVVSAAAAYVKIVVSKTQKIDALVTTPLLQGDFVWPLAVNFSRPISVTTGMNIILEFFGQSDTSQNLDLFTFPLARDLFNQFGLSGVEAGIQPPLDGRNPGLLYASMVFRSAEDWQPSLAFIKLKNIGVGWTFHWYGDTQFVTGNTFGTLVFFDDPTLNVPPLGDGCVQNKIELTLDAAIPTFQITGSTEGDICVPIGAVLKKYLGGTGGLSDDLRITHITFEALPQQQTYFASMIVEGIWSLTVNLVTFSLDRLLGDLLVTQNKVSGSIQGWASIIVQDGGVATTKAVFMASAEYRQDATWHFSGGLADGTLNVLDFAFGLLGAKPSVSLPEINLKELFLEYTATGSDNPYSARGTLELRWKPEVLGMTLSVEAKAAVARRLKTSTDDLVRAAASPALTDGNMIYEGMLSGTVKINSLAVTLGLSFTDKETVYLFELVIGKVTFRAATQWVNDRTPLRDVNRLHTFLEDPTGRHQVIVVTLGGFTLGEMVEYLVHLANPNANYQLDAPWTFLNSIDLDRFVLTIDPKYQTITLTYAVDLTLPFASIKTVGLLYDRSSGEGIVNFVLEGSFLGKSYSAADGNALTWDAVNDPPPQVPGKGPKLFDLRYLGAGQHMTLPGQNFNSVTEVLKQLREQMKPPKSMTENPFAGSAIRFDASSQWMFGIDCTVMGTVRVGIILHDPDLYGMVLSLAGPEAGSLSGLSFELLYKKITDNVGMFRVRLQVPDMYRQINLGYVSITLGIITVDIFTNGNFKVDLGFPHNRDFSLSFGLEAGPFIGSGGVYFGLLDGATSSRVPAITNGTFAPVLELGIGLSVGVGRTFNKGPLKAGVYVQLVAIFEGVLGWFHPTDESTPKAMYYWAQGSAGLIGKLYGSVDFKIIKVSVSVEAHAIVSITFAAYRETLVELDVGVEVSAEITILFVTISFSFSLRLTMSFTIGESSVAPWILAADQSGRTTGLLHGKAAVPGRRRPLHVRELTRRLHLRERFGHAVLRARLAGAAPVFDLSWPDIAVFPDGAVHPVTLKMLPAYTIDQVPVQWPGQAVPASPAPGYRIAFLLMADSAVSFTATTIHETRRLTARHSAAAVDTPDVSFNVLIEAMLRWSLAATGLDPVTGNVTPGQLDELVAQLALPQTAASLDMATLSAFFVKNIAMQLSGVPAGSPAQSGGTAFPIPPPLGWDASSGAGDQRRFDAFRLIDASYEAGVKEYFAQLDPDPESWSPVQTVVPPPAGGTLESMATFVFRDYFLMLAKAAVEAAQQVMAAFPYTVTGASGETLTSIAAPFPTVTDQYIKRTGDTVDQVAGFYGMAPSEITALNPNLRTALDAASPGDPVPVMLGVTAESLAAANPAWPLVAAKPIALGNIVHQLGDGETFTSMAAKFGAVAETWLQQPELLSQSGLLAENAPLPVPRSSFANAGSLDLVLVAAFFYIRFGGTSPGVGADDGVPLVEWYLQAIAGMNTIVDDALPAVLNIPKAFDNTTEQVTWTTLPGDSLSTVAAMFAVYQNQAGNVAFAAWLASVQSLNPGTPPFARIILPATQTVVQRGETLAALASRLPLQLPDGTSWLDAGASFRALVQGALILLPLAVVTIPDCNVTTSAGQTLASFAAFYDLGLEDTGARLATVGGLLAVQGGRTFVIPHPPMAHIGSSTATTADLVPAVIAGHAATIGGQASRFLVSGLRMPAPAQNGTWNPSGAMTGLYQLVGQQLSGPLPPAVCPPPDPPPDPPPAPWTVTVKNFDTTATWLTLFDSTTLSDDVAVPAELHGLNRGLAHRDRVEGLVALSAPADSIVFTITDVDTCDYYPATVLQQVFTVDPGPRALYRDVPVRHAMQQVIRWQTTETIALPNPGHVTPPANVMPSIWLFSNDLMGAELQFPDARFELCTVDPQRGPAGEPTELSLYAWAMVLDVRIRTIPGLPNTYEVFGADTAGRQLLLALWQYLTLPSQTDTATIHLLYQQSVSAGLPTGLSSTPVSAGTTYLVKTNLSTVTQSGPVAADFLALDPPTFGYYYARMADASRFLTLLWECSVVGGSGYWLQYTTPDGSGLPPSIFASDGTATVSLLITLATQMNAESPVHTLHSFNNCAVAGNSIDASASNLFARVANDAETTRQSTVAPGNVAFTTSLEKPPKNSWPVIDKEIALRSLYSLLAYQLTDAPTFKASTPGMPAGPQPPRSTAGLSDESTWEIFQVLPVWRYAKTMLLPQLAGLPDPALNPYAGINGATSGGQPVMANANLTLWFQDVLGNASLATGLPSAGGPFVVSLPVGYTDPVIGVGAWPATTTFFGVDPVPAGSGALLTVTLALQASSHLPGAAQRTSESVKTAKDHLTRFTNIWYQLLEPDVTVALSTTLEVTAGQPAALATTGGVSGFATAACAWLGAASQLLDVYVDTALAPTLAGVSATYGTGYDGLATANGLVPLAHIFPTPPAEPTEGIDFTIPVFAVFKDNDTVASISGATDPVSVLQDPNNISLPLRATAELVIPSRTYEVPPDPLPPTLSPSLAEIAAENDILVSSLIAPNAATPGLLRETFVFTCDGIDVNVDETNPNVTLDDVSATFLANGVQYTAVMVATANADRPGMFRAGASLTVNRYLLIEWETLEVNGSGATAGQLAPLNTATANLFYSGTAVYLTFRAAGSAFDHTLAETAGLFALSSEQLLRHNAAVALSAVPTPPPDPSYLAIPGHAALPPAAQQPSLRIPYAIPAGGQLSLIAALFLDADPAPGSAALALAQANLQMPDVLAAGKSITAGGQTVTTNAGDSFASLLARFDPAVPLADVVTFLQSTAGFLNAGALLVVPPAKLPVTKSAYTPNEVAALYGVTVNDLAVANSGLAGLVVPGITLVSPLGGATPPTITTGDADTFVSFVWRFSQVDVQTSTAAVVTANADVAFLAGAAVLLLPPPAALLSATFGASGWKFPAAIFDIHAWLQISRDVNLVDPKFRGLNDDGPAVLDRAFIPPVPKSHGGVPVDQYLALQAFARDLETAVPALRIATGRVLSEERELGSTDVWGVAFGSGYIAEVDVHPGVTAGTAAIPQYYALRPLANALVAKTGVAIQPLLTDGTLGDSVPTNFQGIDLEVWANRFLSDVDLFLSAPYAAAAYRTPQRQSLESVITSKQELADGIVKGLDYVLDFGQPNPSHQTVPPPDWLSACESLRQRLLISLAAGYGVDAVVQYQSTVTSPWSRTFARLSGAGKLAAGGTADQLRTTLSNAKTSLATTPENEPGFVNFLLDLAEQGVERTVDLDLSYAVNEVEFNVTEIVDGYDASDWLGFVRPFNANLPPVVTFDLGEPSVPVPVRGYPPLPSLIGQTALASHAAPVSYEQALHWDYAFIYQHQSIAVDQMRVEVELNQAPLDLALLALTDGGLFESLAQYYAVAPGLWAILGGLPGYDSSPTKSTIENAMFTLATLVAGVAANWGPHWTVLPLQFSRFLTGTGPQPELYAFTQTLDAALNPVSGRWEYTTLDLLRTQADGTLGWPNMGVVVNGEVVEMGNGVDTAQGRRYDFPSGVEAFKLLALEMRFVSLHIATYQNASAQVQVIRNALLSDLAPTRKAFVYQTPWLAFPDAITPLLSWRDPFAIGTWSWTAATNPLGAVFTSMFDGSDVNRSINCGVRYGFELATSASASIVPYLPVKYRPKFTYAAGTVTGTLPDLIAAIQEWNDREQPVTTGGEWLVAFSLFSSVDGQLDRPLLELPLSSKL